MKDLQKENEYLKQRIKYLELIIEINQEAINKAINTNSMLVDWLTKKLS